MCVRHLLEFPLCSNAATGVDKLCQPVTELTLDVHKKERKNKNRERERKHHHFAMNGMKANEKDIFKTVKPSVGRWSFVEFV